MKKCSYCGKVYADTATVCEVDQNPLWQVDPPQLPGTVPPPPANRQEILDNEHIRLLAIFQYIFGGFALAGLLFLLVHFLIMSTVFSTAMSSNFRSRTGGPTPEILMAIMAVFYVIGGAMLVAAGVANILSANFMRQRKYRTFSIVVACVNCLQIPLGTVLGIFTIVVLSRESVRAQYSAGQPAPVQG